MQVELNLQMLWMFKVVEMPLSKNQSNASRSGRSFDSSPSVFGPLAKATIKTIGCDVTQICTPETLGGSNGFLQTGSGPRRALKGPQTSL